MSSINQVNVFTHVGRGGNPCPIMLDASTFSAQDMQAIARASGHESGFVLPPPSADYDRRFRFWVPNHEMEMCGHATLGMLWLLARNNVLLAGEYRIATASGPVTGFIVKAADGNPIVEITQPAAKVVNLTGAEEADVLATLRVTRVDLLDGPVQNAVTSRIKTLVPMRNVDRLHTLVADMARTEACCARIGSTGLYPYAFAKAGYRLFEARQLPRSSGYPEDAATGIAAAALAFGLLRNGLISKDDAPIRVLQGRARGRLSEIRVRLGFSGDQAIGCLLGGDVVFVK